MPRSAKNIYIISLCVYVGYPCALCTVNNKTNTVIFAKFTYLSYRKRNAENI